MTIEKNIQIRKISFQTELCIKKDKQNEKNIKFSICLSFFAFCALHYNIRRVYNNHGDFTDR